MRNGCAGVQRESSRCCIVQSAQLRSSTIRLRPVRVDTVPIAPSDTRPRPRRVVQTLALHYRRQYEPDAQHCGETVSRSAEWIASAARGAMSSELRANPPTETAARASVAPVAANRPPGD